MREKSKVLTSLAMHTFHITKLIWFELLSCLLVTRFPAPPIPGI